MWLCSQHGFYSIVADASAPGNLLVRARDREHLQSLLPRGGDLQVRHTPDHDYPYRVSLPVGDVLSLVGEIVESIDYPNFKSRVDNKWRGTWYSRALHQVWEVMFFAAKDRR